MDYLWPDVEFSLGQKTAIVLGVVVSIFLTVLYSVNTWKAFGQKVDIPEQMIFLAGPELLSIVRHMAVLMNGLCAGTAVYYIYSIGVKQSSKSALFLVIWMIFEDVSVVYSMDIPWMFIFGLMTIWSYSAYTATKVDSEISGLII